MFKTLKLGQKIIAGFAVVTLIATFMGIFGYYGITKIIAFQGEAATVLLPSVEHLMTIHASQSEVKAAIRTLLIPGLAPDRIENQFRYIQEAFTEVDQAMKDYEALPIPAKQRLPGKILSLPGRHG